jgi:hypothetical protein
MQKSAIKRKRLLFVILLFCIVEGIILLSYREFSALGINMDYPPSNQNRLAGHILFTGDNRGTTGLAGCERLGSLSRRATILTGFNDYIYLDFGNVTKDYYQFNQRALPLLEEALCEMNLGGLNLTKRDLIKFRDAGVQFRYIPLVSANLHIESPKALKQLVSRFLTLPLYLSNPKETRQITIGVTGITGNPRILHDAGLRFKVTGAAEALKDVMPELNKTDLKVLLFRDTIFHLEEILAEPGISFHLVLASSTLPEHVNKMIELNGTPVAFVDEDGRSIGHVRVTTNKTNGIGGNFTFNYDALIPGLGIKENKRVKALVNRMISNDIHSPEPSGGKNTHSGGDL